MDLAASFSFSRLPVLKRVCLSLIEPAWSAGPPCFRVIELEFVQGHQACAETNPGAAIAASSGTETQKARPGLRRALTRWPLLKASVEQKTGSLRFARVKVIQSHRRAGRCCPLRACDAQPAEKTAGAWPFQLQPGAFQHPRSPSISGPPGPSSNSSPVSLIAIKGGPEQAQWPSATAPEGEPPRNRGWPSLRGRSSSAKGRRSGWRTLIEAQDETEGPGGCPGCWPPGQGRSGAAPLARDQMEAGLSSCQGKQNQQGENKPPPAAGAFGAVIALGVTLNFRGRPPGGEHRR